MCLTYYFKNSQGQLISFGYQYVGIFSILANTAAAFMQSCLKAHNDYRKKHGSPPLVWDTSLEGYAQAWADNLAKKRLFAHDIKGVQNRQEGENIAFTMPGCADPKKCVNCANTVKMWYDEIKDYDFKTGKEKTPGKQYLHFTQVGN